MRWIVGIGAVMAFALLVGLDDGEVSTFPRGTNGGIRVIAGVDRPIKIRNLPDAPSITMSVPPMPEHITVAKTDAAALAELYAVQSPDPAWAPRAEAEIRSHMSTTGDVRCAEFMCRIALPLQDQPAITSADQLAEAISRHFPTDLSYNRFTATFVGDRQNQTVIFYVTRSEDRSHVM